MSKEQLEKIKAKVGKIMALAGNNPSEEEAALAAARAKEILDKYGMTMDDITTNSENAQFGEEQGDRKVRFQIWEDYLMGHIARIFDCELIKRSWRVGFGACSKRWSHCLIGYKQDVEIAMFTYKMLHRTIEDLAEKYVRMEKRNGRLNHVRSTVRAKQSFCTGASFRIIQRVEETRKARVEQEPQTQALVLVKKDRVAEYVKSTIKPTISRAKDKRSTGGSERAFAHGVAAADGIQLNKAVNDGDGPTKIR